MYNVVQLSRPWEGQSMDSEATFRIAISIDSECHGQPWPYALLQQRGTD